MRFRLQVSGNMACFTRPELKAERFSYDVITPSAARGVAEAIYWKPGVQWQIDAIHVLKPIRFASFRRNEVTSKIAPGNVKRAMNNETLDGLRLIADSGAERNQRATVLLVDVAYVIEASFRLTGEDRNIAKHLEMFRRRAAKGQCFHQPYLGTREFPADFRLLEDDEPTPPAIEVDRDLGLMLWDVDHGATDKPAMFFRAVMQRGVIAVPPPGSVEIYR